MNSAKQQILHWYKQGYIKDHDIEAALSELKVIPDQQQWAVFIQRFLLWLGVPGLGFSLLFFIAWNWYHLDRLFKFGLIELALAACLFFYWYSQSQTKPEHPGTQVSLTGAAFMVGILLAFFGQTYQTGADPWQLFAFWALFILPWVIIARFAALWLLLILLINMALFLFLDVNQHFPWLSFFSAKNSLWFISVFNLLAWAIWEYATGQANGLKSRWAINTLAFLSCSFITLLQMNLITDASLISFNTLVYILMIAGMGYFYRIKKPDVFILATLCLSVISVIITLFARYLLQSRQWDTGSFFILTVCILMMSTIAITWLKKVHKGIQP